MILDFGRTGSCLRYQRHCVATVALLNLSSEWGRLIVAIDQLKQEEISVEDYIQAAKSLLSRIIEERFDISRIENLDSTIKCQNNFLKPIKVHPK